MRNKFILLATLILLVAAVLRLSALHRYPPGPHYDEAVNLLVARSIIYGGARPFPIVEAYQGREVLYMYLNAGLLPALGDRMFTFHLTNAWLNLLTIAASMALGRAMFRGRRGWAVGLVAGLLMTLSFPQVWLARQAFRAVTLPFCQAFALLFLWRGLRSRAGWGWLALGGAFAGLALYTYMASRLFPVWLLLAGALLLLLDAERRGLRLRQGALFFGVLALVALPMGLYALEKPDIFLGRLAEVTQPGVSVTLAESVLLHLRMFFVEGDPYLRYNIPGRPYLTFPEGILMLAGTAVAAWRLLRAGPALERTAYGLALMSPLMVVPSLISVGGFPPSHMRSLGMVPLLFVLVAVGAEWLWRRAVGDNTRRFALVLAGVLAVGGLLAGSTYFAWAGRADLYYESDADLAAAAAWLPQNSGDAVLYVAARDRGHPTVEIAETPPVTWLGTETLFRAPPGRDGLYIFPRSAPPHENWLAWLEPGRIIDLPTGPDGRTAFEAFRVAGDSPLPDFEQTPAASVSNRFLTLLGTNTPAVAAGSTTTVETVWRVEAPADASDLTPLLQLVDANGTRLSRADAYLTETDRWRSGEVLFQRLRLHVPVGTPPGNYGLQVAWVARSADRYLPYSSGQVWADIGELMVQRPDAPPDPAALTMDVAQALEFADGVRLLGWNRPPASARPGERLPVTLFWQATPTSVARTAVHAEIILSREDASERIWQGELLEGRYSASRWQTGEIVTEHAVWRVPRDMEAGTYTLVARSERSEVALGTLTVEGLPRLYQPPDNMTPVDAAFGPSIRLAGTRTEVTGQRLTVTLVWQAMGVVEQDLTVFVHVVNTDGQIIAQRDVTPQDGAYPTSLWDNGEYIVDVHAFASIPEGAYTVAAGLYSQETGARVTVTLPDGEIQDYIELLHATMRR